LFAGGVGLLALNAGETPHYVSDFMPGFVLGGIGVGFVLPSTQGAAMSTLPPALFSTGTAKISMARQIGAALGIALLVAVIGTPEPGHVVDAFRPVWRLEILAALGAGIAMLAVGPLRAPAVAPVPAEVTA
jgi:hypothetical protein